MLITYLSCYVPVFLAHWLQCLGMTGVDNILEKPRLVCSIYMNIICALNLNNVDLTNRVGLVLHTE